MDPLHLTEFASAKYFNKLRQLDSNENGSSSPQPTATQGRPQTPQSTTFTIPLGNPRPSYTEDELSQLSPREQKKRSIGHDLISSRTQRRPSFAGSFGRLSSKITVSLQASSIFDHRDEILTETEEPSQGLTLGILFTALPKELQEQIVSPLPIHDMLNLRLVSKSFHAAVALNENPIARYHVAHSLPDYAKKLYPLPPVSKLNLHYVCEVWHRLHVASKLATMITRYAARDIFLRNTPVLLKEFEPQYRRMLKRLIPAIFTMFHFFETYRQLHIQHLLNDGIPLNRCVYERNPFEVAIMESYDNATLLKTHSIWTLAISSFNRRLRPPSYVGAFESMVKGYLKGRPADEVYSTIVAVGGLRQAEKFWETKGYNIRRAAVDTWYSFVTKTPVEPVKPSKIKMTKFASIGRKKAAPIVETAASTAHLNEESCGQWFCVNPTCREARRRHSTDNLVFHSSLGYGPPMSPLSRQQLAIFVPDIPHMSNMWIHTAEALIIERRILTNPQEYLKINKVLLELIRDDGTDDDIGWQSGNPNIVQDVGQDGVDGYQSD